MKGLRIANRYAKSLMQLAQEQNVLESIYADMQLLSDAIDESKDLALLLSSPVVKSDKKAAILRQIFEGKLNDLSLRFVLLVTDQKRENALSAIAKQFLALYKESKNIATVEVTTAVAMNDGIRQQLLETIKKNYQFAEVELIESVDETLIGGLVMRIGDKQLDESIRRKIKDVEKELLNA